MLASEETRKNFMDAIAKRGVVHGPTAWDGYVAAVTADALVKSQQIGAEEPIVTGEIPAFYRQ